MRLHYFIALLVVMFTVPQLALAGELNTFNSDFTINLPDRAEDVADIQPFANGGMFGSQITYGVTSIPTKYSNQYILFNEIGFQKSSYKPYQDTITREKIFAIETFTVLAGRTIYFFHNSSHPLILDSVGGILPNFGMTEATTRSAGTPFYQYTFAHPGTYTIRNKLKPYQQLYIDVKDPAQPGVCEIAETYTKEDVTRTNRYRAPWCDVPTEATSASSTSPRNPQKEPIPKKEEQKPIVKPTVRFNEPQKKAALQAQITKKPKKKAVKVEGKKVKKPAPKNAQKK